MMCVQKRLQYNIVVETHGTEGPTKQNLTRLSRWLSLYFMARIAVNKAKGYGTYTAASYLLLLQL